MGHIPHLPVGLHRVAQHGAQDAAVGQASQDPDDQAQALGPDSPAGLLALSGQRKAMNNFLFRIGVWPDL